MNPITTAPITPSVLIAVDGSPASLQAVRYGIGMAGLIPGLKFVLLNVLPSPPPIFASEARTDAAMKKRLERLEEANRRRAEDVVALARDEAVRGGIEPDRIETRVRARRGGLAKDIITEAELGHFDAIVVGRRGLTLAQEIFMGSVSSQLIQHAANVPLWINDGEVTEPRVLVAIDGSEASLRAVDHVSFMLGRNPETRIEFLHVTPKLQAFCPVIFPNSEDLPDADALEQDFLRNNQDCLESFYHRAMSILAEAGVSRDRVSFQEKEVLLGVARTIVREAKEGGFGTVVVGRRGLGQSSYLGSVSDRVIRRADNLAVWLVG